MRKLLIAAALSATVSTAGAGGIPVIDVASIAEAIRTITELERQRTILTDQLEQLRGSTGMGALLEDAGHREMRRYAPSLDELDAVLSGDAPGPVTAHVAALVSVMAMEDPADLFTGDDAASVSLRNRYTRERETYVSSYGVAAASYDQAPARTDSIESLSGRIDSASSMKSALDLQNRIAAENAHLLNEVARLQAAELRAASEYRAAEMQQRTRARANLRRAAAHFWSGGE